MITARRLFTLLLGVIISIGLFAEPISREQARVKAQAYLKKLNASQQLAPVSNRARLAPRRAKATSDDLDLYYVFSRGEGKGFVITSGDDRTMPILGYTDEGDFDYNQLNPNMRHWLDTRESELLELSTRVSESIPVSAPPTHPKIDYMVTTKWNQGWPYNNECPMYFNKGRSVTGCAATAMAQLLYFQRAKSVKETQAEMPSYTGGTADATYGNLHVDGIPAGSPIDWGNMLNEYTSSATAKQQNAVAQLMHYCGVSIYMDYTNNSSGAQPSDVPGALQKYFGYGSKTRIIYQNDYSENGWDNILYNELVAGRPFFLAGYTVNENGELNAGHAFLSDGYDGAGCFHINWGWGGQSDGFYVLTKLNPGSQGIGGSDGGYSTYENAVIYFEPENYGSNAMTFAKANVKKLCVAAWDTGGGEDGAPDGELSYDEAAAVTDLGEVFKGQKITEFNELYYFTGLTSIPDEAFMGCTSLVGIKLPKNVTSIGKRAFAKNAKMKLTLHEGILSIGDSAFAGCKVMANQSLPISLTRIEDNTFENCVAFSTLTIPNTIKYIGTHAFKGCTKLTTVNLKSITPQNITLGDEVFAGIDLSKATLNTEQGLGAYLRSTPQWSDFGTIYEERTLAQGRFASTLETKKPYYLCNVATGMYLTKGEAWGTQAIVEDTDQPMRFEFRNSSTMADGIYYLYSEDTGKDGHILFRTTEDDKLGVGVKACFVDGATSHITDKTSYWRVAKVEGSDNIFTLQIPSGLTDYEASQYLGIMPDHQSNVAAPTYGTYFDIDYTKYNLNCQWMLVPYDETEVARYQAAMQLKNLLAIGKTKRADIELETITYENFNSTTEELQKACRQLRKKMNFINFVDDEVRKISVANYDADGNGEISYTEAADVDEINEYVFSSNTKIKDLSDMQYFTKAAYVSGNSFNGCTNLLRIILPPNIYGIFYQSFWKDTKLEYVEVGNKVTTIGSSAFRNCKKLKEFRISVSDPSTITLADSIFYNTPIASATLYVPYGSKALYEKADVWKNFGTIKEMRAIGTPQYTPLKPGERVYIYNYNTHAYLNAGEAYGTQAVTADSPLIFQIMQNQDMPDSLYYLKSTKGILFRTDNDTKVGKGVKACFVDGKTERITNKTALWSIKPVEGKENVYTIQVPATDASYVEGEYLGTDLSHTTDYNYYYTYGVYYDVTSDDIPAKCEWSFIGLDEIEADEAIFAQSQELKVLLEKANSKGIDVTEEQAVYDDFSSTEQQIDDAISSIKQKLHYITFTDAKAKSISLGRWDNDEDGELSLEEAASVTDISTAFKSATAMKSFEELQYFTSLISIPSEAFYGCTALNNIYLPKNITSIGQKAFYNCSALKYIAIPECNDVIEASTANLPSTFTLYVPADQLEAYSTDAAWSKATHICEYTGIPNVETQSATRIYGRLNPTFTYIVTGAPINGAPTFSTIANEKTPIGQYPIVAGQGSITNDNVILTPGIITITRAPLTISARSYTRNVGEENPEFEFINSMLRNSELIDTVLLVAPTIECDATVDSPAGEYEIRIYGAVTNNYEISYVNGKLTVVDPTGIADVNDEGLRVKVDAYDLSGRKVNVSSATSHLKKGLYIINKRKQVIK